MQMQASPAGISYDLYGYAYVSSESPKQFTKSSNADTVSHPSYRSPSDPGPYTYTSIVGLPSVTPSAPTTISLSKNLHTSATAFVPRKPVTVKNPEGVEMDLAEQVAANGSVPPSPAGLRHGSPGTSSKRLTSVRIESEDQRKQQLAEEKEKEGATS